MDKSLFIDTAYFIALINKDDKHHHSAIKISNLIASEKINLVSTELILIETANFLARTKFRTRFTVYVERLRKSIWIAKGNDSDLTLAWSLYTKMSDKEWSLTDCYSFVVMKKFEIKQALTTDKHFEQAGFERLLKQP